MSFEKIGFIGLGLIGGSIAKTIHRIYPEITLIAYDIDENLVRSNPHIKTIYKEKIKL